MKSLQIAAAVALAIPVTGVVSPAQADEGRPSVYTLSGDPEAPAGSKFEGIGYDRTGGRFYVSETTGGEIHRGDPRLSQTQVWLAGDGSDGRFTARGITVDKEGRVYIAGGPNGISNPGRPDLWVYSRSGELLAALRVPESNAFLNDVAIGPDGAAYFTNSNAPQIFRVSEEDGVWGVTTWADASDTIPTFAGFNLGGIVVSRDRSALVVAQGNTGDLWRFDLGTREVSAVDTGGADLTNADGLVLRGSRLAVVRNFSRAIAVLRLDASGTAARLLTQQATDPDRVFTTAKLVRGRLLLVDSKFDEPVGLPPYQVVAQRMP